MANSTTFLTLPAGRRLGTDVVHFEKYVDTTLENVASGDTIDVLRLPKGAVPVRLGFICNTPQPTLTWGLDVVVGGSTVITGLPATNLSAALQVAVTAAGATGGFTTAMLSADGTLRATAGAAAATTFKGTFFCDYFVSDQGL